MMLVDKVVCLKDDFIILPDIIFVYVVLQHSF